jgi:hypothetical protein
LDDDRDFRDSEIEHVVQHCDIALATWQRGDLGPERVVTRLGARRVRNMMWLGGEASLQPATT